MPYPPAQFPAGYPEKHKNKVKDMHITAKLHCLLPEGKLLPTLSKKKKKKLAFPLPMREPG